MGRNQKLLEWPIQNKIYQSFYLLYCEIYAEENCALARELSFPLQTFTSSHQIDQRKSIVAKLPRTCAQGVNATGSL